MGYWTGMSTATRDLKQTGAGVIGRVCVAADGRPKALAGGLLWAR
ncbi:hypothetical protein GCM10009525_22720 [Streptosporangium amethystogenes subsp. fukuiense]